MNEKIILDLVEKGESDTLEFKRNFDKDAKHQMDIGEVTDLHLKTFNTSWDYYIDNHHSIEDISLEKVRAFIELANKYKDIKISDDPIRLLNKFELIRENKITYGGFLLFMKDTSALTTIDLGRFQTSTIIKDSVTLKSDLFSEVEAVMDFIKKHINKSYKEANIIEKYGSGIKRIQEGFSAHGLLAPRFEEIGSGFRVTVFKNNNDKDRIKGRSKDRIKGEKPKYPGKTPIKPEEKEKILMQKISKDPLVTAEELSAFLNMNVRNTRKYLAKLKEEGKIKRVGSRKNGRWEVI